MYGRVSLHLCLISITISASIDPLFHIRLAVVCRMNGECADIGGDAESFLPRNGTTSRNSFPPRSPNSVRKVCVIDPSACGYCFH
jgi:hypothetical protein